MQNASLRGAEDAYGAMERRVTEWAQSQPDVLAAIVVGSRARLDHPADQFSDLDVILLVRDPQALAQHTQWLDSFGQVWAAAAEQAGPDPEWLVVYAGGLKADFALSSAGNDPEASLESLLERSPHRMVLERGVRVLVNKLPAGVEKDYPVPVDPIYHPDAQEFTAAVNQFLVSAMRAAKLVRRGDLWRAKMACDCELKQHLLTMLAWHARAVHGLRRDTWYDGRFINDWADRRALEALPMVFGQYDQGDLKRALMATLDMYSWLGRSTAEQLGYTYPDEAEGHIWPYIGSMLGDIQAPG